VARAQNPQRAPPPAPRVPNKYKWPEKPVLIGTSVKRLDAPDKVSGRAKYSYDINRPGMLYGKIIRSPSRTPRSSRSTWPRRGARLASRRRLRGRSPAPR
jgi:hypothetical protein